MEKDNERYVINYSSDILFFTSKGDVYMKTEGGKQKLDAQGIQNELKSRLR